MRKLVAVKYSSFQSNSTLWFNACSGDKYMRLDQDSNSGISERNNSPSQKT